MPRVHIAGPDSHEVSDYSFPKREGEEATLLYPKTAVARRAPMPEKKKVVVTTSCFLQQTMEFVDDDDDKDDEDVLYIRTVRAEPAAKPAPLTPTPVHDGKRSFIKQPVGRPRKGCVWNSELGRWDEVSPAAKPPAPRKRVLEVDDDEPLNSLLPTAKKQRSTSPPLIRPKATGTQDEEGRELLSCPECAQLFPEKDFAKNIGAVVCLTCDRDNTLEVGDTVSCYDGIYVYGDRRGMHEGVIVKICRNHCDEPIIILSTDFIASDERVTKLRNRGSAKPLDITRYLRQFKMTMGELSEEYIKEHGLHDWKDRNRMMIGLVRQETRKIFGNVAY